MVDCTEIQSKSSATKVSVCRTGRRAEAEFPTNQLRPIHNSRDSRKVPLAAQEPILECRRFPRCGSARLMFKLKMVIFSSTAFEPLDGYEHVEKTQVKRWGRRTAWATPDRDQAFVPSLLASDILEISWDRSRDRETE